MVTHSWRDAFRSELTAVAGGDGRVVCLETLPRAKDHPFEAAHPDRFFSLPNVGSVLTQMATGLGAAGFRPFVVLTAGAGEGRPVVPPAWWRDCLEAGATVVVPPEAFPDGYDEVRRMSGVPLAVPCGEAEIRAVVRQAARSRRPHCLVLGEGPGTVRAAYGEGEVPLVSWELTGTAADTRLVSVGAAGTRLALAARAAAPRLGHAHLVYVDEARLSAAAGEIAGRPGKLVVIAAPRLLDPVLRAMRARMPDRPVLGVPACAGRADVAHVLAAAAGAVGVHGQPG
ncbi:hypothetical protein [Streptomyces collinus]|uniref:hypothetical protein n=1 Tax=Streptomyces collinus TaxID=42684 RepID=UPI0034106998